MPPLLMNPNLDMLSAALAVPQQRTSILGQDQVVHFTFEQKHAAAFPDKRHLTIEPGQTLIISRASKSKDSMSPKITNLLYDCPVMSRAHAELKHNRFAPLHEQITITDRDSKHGTSVNDKRLEPHKSFALRSGDIVKLGGKVVSGSEVHDGIEVAFIRDILPHHRPVSGESTNSFQVPDPSDDESLVSDVESAAGHNEKTSSSATTTPEKPKQAATPAIGSQEKPIDLEGPTSTPGREDITLDDDDADTSLAHSWLSEKSVELQGDDVESNSEHDEHEYDDDESVADNLSDSDASDLSKSYKSDFYRFAGGEKNDEEDDGVVQQDGQQREEVYNYLSQPSPQLGSTADATSTLLTPFEAPISTMAEHAIEPTTRSQQFYTAPAPSYPLGLPEFILPASNPTKELPQVGSITPVQFGPRKAAADSRLSIRNLVETSRDEQPLNRPSFTTNDSPMLAGQADREDNVLSTKAEAGPTERAASVAPAQIAGSKRKADDISIDAGSAAEELFKMYMETFRDEEATVPAPAPAPAPTVAGTVERPAKRTRLITQAGKYAASAAVGSAAMFAFLVSPWCEQLLEWGAA